jgi:hypothetical protein
MTDNPNSTLPITQLQDALADMTTWTKHCLCYNHRSSSWHMMGNLNSTLPLTQAQEALANTWQATSIQLYFYYKHRSTCWHKKGNLKVRLPLAKTQNCLLTHDRQHQHDAACGIRTEAVADTWESTWNQQSFKYKQRRTEASANEHFCHNAYIWASLIRNENNWGSPEIDPKATRTSWFMRNIYVRVERCL